MSLSDTAFVISSADEITEAIVARVSWPWSSDPDRLLVSVKVGNLTVQSTEPGQMGRLGAALIAAEEAAENARAKYGLRTAPASTVETFKCARCGAQFGIAGVSTGSPEDLAVDEYHRTEVERHQSGQCTPIGGA